MGRLNMSGLPPFIGFSMGLVIAGLIAPTATLAQPHTLQPQAEEFSRNCVQQVAQVDATRSEVIPPELVQSVAVCQQAVALTQIANNRRLEAYSLGNLGTLYLQQQDYQQALTFYQQALRIAETVDDFALRTKVLIALGTVYLKLEQYQQAFNFYQQALTNAQATSDPTGIAIAHYNLGLTYDTLGQYQQSVNAYQNAATIAQEMGDLILETYALNKIKLAQALIVSSEQAAKL